MICLLGQLGRTARLTLSLVWMLWLCPGAARGDAVANLSPTEFKAAFLSKILAYVTWPADALTNTNQPLVIGLYSYDPFDGLIQKLVSGQTVNDHKVVVEILTDTNRLGDCQVLYIPDDKLADWLKLKPDGPDRGVLTIGADSTGEFLRRGGVFNLLVEERKLEINRGNAEQAGLKINSKLLRIAKID